MSENQNRRADDKLDKLDHHQSRIDRLEGVVEGLAVTQAKAETQLASLSVNVERMSHSFEVFAERSTTESRLSSRTNWGVVISGVSALLALVVVLGTGFVGVPLNNLTNTVQGSTELNRLQHIKFADDLADLKQEQASVHATTFQVNAKQDSDILELQRIVINLSENTITNTISHASMKERMQTVERQLSGDIKPIHSRLEKN